MMQQKNPEEIRIRGSDPIAELRVIPANTIPSMTSPTIGVWVISEVNSSATSSVSESSLFFLRRSSISATFGLYEDKDPLREIEPSETILTIESLFAIVRNSDLTSPLEINQIEVAANTVPDANWSGKLSEFIDRTFVMTIRINAEDAGFRMASIFSTLGKKIASITTLLNSAKNSVSGVFPKIDSPFRSLNQFGVANSRLELLPVLKTSIGTDISPMPRVKTRSSPKFRIKAIETHMRAIIASSRPCLHWTIKKLSANAQTIPSAPPVRRP